jgi:exodeoxyribonuclease V alpha subunit
MTFERAIDRTFSAWVRQKTGSELLARAAYCASRDEALGHSCAALAEDSEFTSDDIEALRRERWVGDGSAFTPFVVDANGSFYLWRNWRHETTLAAALRARAGSSRMSQDVWQADIDALFANSDQQSTRLQRAAVAAVPGARLLVLTGGPGTGKTSTALRMIAMAVRHAQASGATRRTTVALAAPTGKAAQRLTEAVVASRTRLLDELPATSPVRKLLDDLPPLRAQTLHRLLDYRPRDNTFARDAQSPIAADVVIVDETSMVDLATMRQLFDALLPHALVILLGDPGQLYAIEAGSVLGDIVASAREGSPLAANVITLSHVWRAQRGLRGALDALRAGDASWLDAFVKTQESGALRWHPCAEAAALAFRVETWIDAHEAALRTLVVGETDPATALKNIRGTQILCALRETPFGSMGINATMTRMLAKRFGVDVTSSWYHGRPVIVTRNDYARGLFNGDVGIALRGADGLRVWFDAADRDGGPTLRNFSTRNLPEHETAWAITIHRSQGSEYSSVAVVLPPQDDHRILSRELLYTAVSRASARAELWTSAAALRAAASRLIRRRGGLRDRLR